MDAITDRVFAEVVDDVNDDPSLLTVILDVSPESWYNIKHLTLIQEVTKSLLVFVNAHLSLNNANNVAFIATSPLGSRFLYPTQNENEGSGVVGQGMYRQFKMVDSGVLEELNQELERISTKLEQQSSTKSLAPGRSSLAGAMSLALTYSRRVLSVDQTVSTTAASALGAAAGVGDAMGATRARVLVVTANDDDNIAYIPMMNSIFAAQKMKLAVDIAKLGFRNSSYLQQAADATNGVYLHIGQPQGLIQTLFTAFFIEPSLRPSIILPTNSNVNYRASCFITGKSIDVGYVCSVCLCILSMIPELSKCPTCQSRFDDSVLDQLRRKPIVKRRKIQGS